MRVPDLSIRSTANLLVKRHGRDAAIVAAQRVDEYLAAGDVAGEAVWKRIVSEVLELMRDKPPEGPPLN